MDTGSYTGKYNSLALDASGSPHISYYDSTHADVKYAVGTLGHEYLIYLPSILCDSDRSLDASSALTAPPVSAMMLAP